MILSRRRRRRQSGLTLIELMVTVGLMALMTLAVASAFVAGIDNERAQARRSASRDQTAATEQRLTDLLMGAVLSLDANDTVTYFQGAYDGGVPTGSSGSDDLGCDRLTFTTTADAVPLAARDSQDDWDTQHTARGPIGGIAEVSLGTTAVGDVPTEDKTGLFERRQRPADGDPTQGGTESLLDTSIDRIGFRFWNGTAWADTWDTNGSEGKRLPAAVQVSYIIKEDKASTVHSFTIPLPTSDVTADDPVVTGPGQTP